MKKGSKTIFVRWVRSGIGFSTHQKTMIRSLGLRRLNQTVELQDTPQVRGLVACIPHLVEIVEAPAAPALASVAEYSIRADESPAPARRHSKRGGQQPETAAVPAMKSSDSVEDAAGLQVSEPPSESVEGKE